MYKEIIIAIFIILLIFILDYITQKYTDKVINEAILDLQEIQQNLKLGNIDNKKAIYISNEKYQRWLNYHKCLAFYIEHNELEKVETTYVTGNSFIQNEKYEEALAEIEKTIYILKHINDKYSISLENIF